MCAFHALSPEQEMDLITPTDISHPMPYVLGTCMASVKGLLDIYKILHKRAPSDGLKE